MKEQKRALAILKDQNKRVKKLFEETYIEVSKYLKKQNTTSRANRLHC